MSRLGGRHHHPTLGSATSRHQHGSGGLLSLHINLDPGLIYTLVCCPRTNLLVCPTLNLDAIQGGAKCPHLPFGLCPRLWDAAHAPEHEIDDAAIYGSGMGRRENWPSWLLVRCSRC